MSDGRLAAMVPIGNERNNHALCKGDWLLGTACGKCARCFDNAGQAVARLREENERLAATNTVLEVENRLKLYGASRGEAILMLLRQFGWSVAVHNDYRQDGEKRTFWLMVKDEVAFKGEGTTDEEALQQVIDRVFKGDTIRALTELCRILEEVKSK